MHEIGTVWSYREVDALLDVRSRDTDSWLFAKEHNWRYPVSREWMMMAEHYDMAARANFGKKYKKPYPRPWKDAGATRLGKHHMSNRDAISLLKRARQGELEWTR